MINLNTGRTHGNKCDRLGLAVVLVEVDVLDVLHGGQVQLVQPPLLNVHHVPVGEVVLQVVVGG